MTEKTISFPCGDQFQGMQFLETRGVICLSPVPLVLTTNKPSELIRVKPLEDDPFPVRRPVAGYIVAARVGGDLGESPAIGREDRVDAVWLPSSLNVSQSSSAPSGDGIRQGLKSSGSCPSTTRNVPSSGLMIHEPPPGKSNTRSRRGAVREPPGNSPVSVGG